jgi:hypothetical protein
MNKIELDLTGNIPLLTIKIDGLDHLSIEEIKDKYLQVSVPEFLFNEYMWTDSVEYNVYNGTMLVGVCSCDCQGCDDLLAEITTKDGITKWTIFQDRDHDKKKAFIFDANQYKTQIEKITSEYYSYSWETEQDKFRRLCNEFIRKYKTKDGFNIEGTNIKINYSDEDNTIFESYGDTIRIYYHDGWEPAHEGYARSTQDWNIKFDGKTLENALAELAKFAAENLVINPDEVSLRPEPFKLLYTKDKNMIEMKQSG